MDIFDGRNKVWTLESNAFTYDRLKIYSHIVNRFDNQCQLNIEKRIGMESTMAEVYKVNIQEFEVAAKLLPILSNESLIGNQKEIEFATKASELVLSKESVYFPLVYTSTFCPETYFYGSSNPQLKFYERSLNYQQFTFLINSIKNQKALNQITKYRKNFVDVNTIINLLHLNVSLSDKVSSYILFSELASFDLDFYLSNYVLSSNDLYYLFEHILNAIEDLQTKLHVVHNDLHLGNILLLESVDSKIGYIPLIHDFGKSRYIEYHHNTPKHYDQVHDLFYFISKFEEKLKEINFNGNLVYSELDVLVDLCNSSRERYPILDLVKYWESIEYKFQN